MSSRFCRTEMQLRNGNFTFLYFNRLNKIQRNSIFIFYVRTNRYIDKLQIIKLNLNASLVITSKNVPQLKRTTFALDCFSKVTLFQICWITIILPKTNTPQVQSPIKFMVLENHVFMSSSSRTINPKKTRGHKSKKSFTLGECKRHVKVKPALKKCRRLNQLLSSKAQYQ